MNGESTELVFQEKTGVNVRFISEWGQQWEIIGIVETDATTNVRGRRRGLFD